MPDASPRVHALPARALPYGRLAVAPVGLDGELLRSTDGEPQVDGKRPPAWSTTLFGSAFAALYATTVKLTDPRWWATEAPERLAQGAAILGVHPALSVQAADAIAFRLESRGSCSGKRRMRTRTPAAGRRVVAYSSACWASSATRACWIGCSGPVRARGAGAR